MFLSLAILAVPIEGFGPLKEGLGVLTREKGVFQGILLLLFPGVLAFCMTSSEFALLKRTSVVTLSICGIFKEVVTISAAGIVFHDPLTPINVSGLLVTIASIGAYNYLKIMKMRRVAREKLKEDDAEDEQPMLVGEGGNSQEMGNQRSSTGGQVANDARPSLSLSTKSTEARDSNLDGYARRSSIKRTDDLE